MTKKHEVSNMNDVIDTRDLIARFEELESIKDNAGGTFSEEFTEVLRIEFDQLRSLLDDLGGRGGDEQWRGDWYPVTLIRDDYFKTYAQELAEDIGVINQGAVWPNNCIDWEQAARELQMDYSTVEFDGVTYWYR
jgi:hypothetical protein